ncbi:MAG: outer membrane protein assembly factor BamA [Salinivirgaceae bacterium]|nr:outer membrane protein assembly factor BamA [Salinivirgaceae bacterium]MBO7432595.1 outer membrane protein assembly factor BamA [Salinivirgaceae bacterium]
MRSRIIVAIILILSAVQAFAQSASDIKIDYSKPKEYEIGGISVSGVKYLNQTVLVNLSGLQVGQKITVPGDDITNALNKLWKHGLFGDVQLSVTNIQDDKIYLDIYLKERPRLSKVEFSGISKSQGDDLRDEIKLTRGSQITDDMIETAKKKIKEFYIKKGFYDAKVSVKQIDDTVMPNTVILHFNIKKNSKVKIKTITFEGNEVLASRKLRRAMKGTKQKTWYNIFRSSKYIEAKYVEDKDKVIAKYNELGYRDANIIFDTVYRNEDKTMNINIRVEEGNRYYFRNIEWVGNTKYPAEMLTSQLEIKSGDVFDQSRLDKRLYSDEDAVSNLYLDRGYLFFQAVPVEVQVENDSIDLQIRLYEGKQARINNIIIHGNDRTNEYVIRRELWTHPGELFSKSDLMASVRELRNMSYFDPEKMDVKPIPNQADGTVDLEFVVVERGSDQVELSGGWGGGMVIGTLGLSFTNFSIQNLFNLESYSPLPTGDGQKLSIRAQTSGKHYRSMSFSFTEPWLGGRKPNSLSLSFYHTVRSSSNVYKSNIEQFMKITGGAIGLGRRLSWPDRYFTLYNELSYQRYNIKNYSILSEFSTGISNNLSITTVIGRNSLDQQLYPRHGANISLSIQLTPPYSLMRPRKFWELSGEERKGLENNNASIREEEMRRKYKLIEFHKWKFKADWFNAIYGNLVLRTNFEFGLLGYYNSLWGYSPFESFQLGGDGMQGGNYYYGYDVIPLRGYDNGRNGNGSLTAYPQGNVYQKLSVELRYPLVMKESATIWAAAFFDAGNSWYEMKDYNPYSLYRSAGVGVRFYLPMLGLLGLDWGYGFDANSRNPGSNGSQFAFTIGQAF